MNELKHKNQKSMLIGVTVLGNLNGFCIEKLNIKNQLRWKKICGFCGLVRQI